MGASEPQVRQGTIVWIDVDDGRGNVKRRPVLVVTPSNEILLDREILGLAITSTFRVPLEPQCVALPWSPKGHPATGLRRPSVVVCVWAVRFRVSDAVSIAGYVPGATLRGVLEVRANCG